MGIPCEDTDLFPNNRGLAVRIVVFDCKLPERSESDIAGSLNGVVRCNGTEQMVEAKRVRPGAGTRAASHQTAFAVRSTG